jgi:hypothetical protein
MSTIQEYTTVACPYGDVPGRLTEYLQQHEAVVALRLPVGDLRVERDVLVRLSPKPGYPGYQLLDVSWTPKDGGAYPDFHGTLTVADEGAGWSRIDIDGSYKPPFGVIGAAFDVAVGHRIAAATAVELLAQLKRILVAVPV